MFVVDMKQFNYGSARLDMLPVWWIIILEFILNLDRISRIINDLKS